MPRRDSESIIVRKCFSTAEEIHVGSWDFSYEQISKGHFRADVVGLQLGSSALLVMESGNQSVYTNGTLSDNKFGLSVFLDCAGSGTVCGKPITSGRVAVFQGGSSYEIYTNNPLSIFTITLDLNDSRFEFLSDVRLASKGASKRATVIFPESDFYNKILHFSKSYLHGLSAVEARDARCALVAAELNDFLVFDLLPDLELATGPNFCESKSGSSAWVLKEVRELLLSNEYEGLSLTDICEKLRISSRTLRKNVFESLGIGPLVFSRYIRLNAVRADIVRRCEKGLDFRISDVAERRGFWHLARFSSHYRDLFGELPSETVRASRGGVSCDKQQLK